MINKSWKTMKKILYRIYCSPAARNIQLALGVLHNLSTLILTIAIIIGMVQIQTCVMAGAGTLLGAVIINQLFYHAFRMIGFMRNKLKKEGLLEGDPITE